MIFNPNCNLATLCSFTPSKPLPLQPLVYSTLYAIMSDATFHTTHDELRKPESRVSRQHHGKTPADSDVSLMKVSYPPGIPQKQLR